MCSFLFLLNLFVSQKHSSCFIRHVQIFWQVLDCVSYFLKVNYWGQITSATYVMYHIALHWPSIFRVSRCACLPPSSLWCQIIPLNDRARRCEWQANREGIEPAAPNRKSNVLTTTPKFSTEFWLKTYIFLLVDCHSNRWCRTSDRHQGCMTPCTMSPTQFRQPDLASSARLPVEIIVMTHHLCFVSFAVVDNQSITRCFFYWLK